MLEPLRYYLANKKIILASNSPRRKEILEKNLGLSVIIYPSTFEENLDKSKFATPADYVVENSRLKALDVANKLKDQDWFLLIGADTVVEMNNKIYEKPLNKEHAINMLKELSNNSHKVSTGVTLVVKTSETLNDSFNLLSFHESTDVIFDNLTEEIIKAYVETGEPLDKAGGYGIQALGSTLVKSITGDYFNVMGFPAHKFSIELKKFLNNI